jgi:ABC-type Mn2+/Zn2+ transport system permease subunit/Mn-dependent DtxR family transcriptional regulator
MNELAAAILAPLQFEFMQRALLAAIMVGTTCAVLSCYLLVKRWALMGDAVSHAVLPGVAIAYLLAGSFFLGAVVAGVSAALAIGFIERQSRVKADAAMGIILTGTFALGLVILSSIRSKSLDLYHILFGNVLGVSPEDLWLTAGTGALVVVLVVVLYRELLIWSFDPVMAAAIGLPTQLLHYLLMVLLSLTIVASLQTVGIILVVAMLITPGATAYLYANRLPTMMALSVAFGVGSAVLGLYLSFYLNVASGGTIVLVASGLFVLSLFLAPRQGLLGRSLRRRRAASRTALEDALREAYLLQSKHEAIEESGLAGQLGVGLPEVRATLRRLLKAGLAETGPQGPKLTAEGTRQAALVVKSHHLWEVYLAGTAGLRWEDAHEEAHRLEHVTSPDMAAQLGRELGHGAPEAAPEPGEALAANLGCPLNELSPGQAGKLTLIREDRRAVLRYLADLGLHPGATVVVRGRDGDGGLRVQTGGREATLDPDVAACVCVTPLARVT